MYCELKSWVLCDITVCLRAGDITFATEKKKINDEKVGIRPAALALL